MASLWEDKLSDNLLVILAAYLVISVPLNLYFYHDVIDKRWRSIRELRRYCRRYTWLAAVSLFCLGVYAAIQCYEGDYKETGAAVLTCFVASYGLYLSARQRAILRFYDNYLKPRADSTFAAYVGEDGQRTPLGNLLFSGPEHCTCRGPVYDNLASVFLDDNYPGEGPRVTWLNSTPEVRDWTELMVRTGLWIRLAVLPATTSFDSALRPPPPPPSASETERNALWTVAALKLQFLNTSEKPTERNTNGRPKYTLLKTFIECVEGKERDAWHCWKSILGSAPASEWSEALAELPSGWYEGIGEDGDLAWEVFLALALHSGKNNAADAQDVEAATRAPPCSEPSTVVQHPMPPSSSSMDGAFETYVEKCVKETLQWSEGHIDVAVLMGGFPHEGEKDNLRWMKRVTDIGQLTHRLAALMDSDDGHSTSTEELTVGVDLVVALALLLGAEVEPLEFSSNHGWADVEEVLRARRQHVLHELENGAEAILRTSLERRVRLQDPLHSDVAQSRFRLARFLQHQGKHEEADTLYCRAIQIWIRNGERANAAIGLNARAECFSERAKFEEALARYRECLAIRKEELGAYHLDVAAVLSNMGDALVGQAKYNEAEERYQQALEICRATRDGAQLQVSVSNNLAELRLIQGNNADAKRLYNEALSTDVARHGVNHEDVARDRLNLAMVLEAEGEYDEAEEQYEKAIAIWEDTLGHEAVEVATGLMKLAGLLKIKGHFESAEGLYRRATRIDEKAFGENHPSVATDLSNWAELLQAQGKFAESESLYKRAVSVGEKTLGNYHPDVAVWLNKEGEAMLEMGQFDEARSVLERSLHITEEPGKDKPIVAETLQIMGHLFAKESKHVEAGALYQRSLDIREHVYGQYHPQVAVGLENLAMSLQEQGNYEKAAELYSRSLLILEKTLGIGHPAMARTLNKQAKLLRKQAEAAHPYAAYSLNEFGVAVQQAGRTEGVEELYRRALAIQETKLGVDHPDVARTLNEFGVCARTGGKTKEAKELHRRALAIQEDKLGVNHPDVARTLYGLGVCVGTEGKTKEAEELYRRALSIQEAKLGVDHPDVSRTRQALAIRK